MGQIQNHANAAGHDRKRSQGPKEHVYFASLGCSLLVLASALAWGQGQTSKPQPPDPIKEDRVALKFDQKLAWEHLMKQVSFGPRVPGTDGHIKCRDWLLEELKKNTDTAYTQEFTHKWSKTGKDVTMWNVIGEQGWKDAKVRMVVLAHWDTRPYATEEADPKKKEQPIVGANDGASGVAVLLELARVMKVQRPKDLGIMYLLTDGEDLGPELDEMFLGAVHFSKNPPNPKPQYGILLDMIGDKDLKIPVEQNSYIAARHLVTAFYAQAKAIGLDKTFVPQYGYVISDDHLPLIERGIPTMDLIDFDYAPWHTLGDTPDKCSPDSLGKVGKMMQAWLERNPPYKLPN